MINDKGISNISSVIDQYSFKKAEPEKETSEKDMFLELMMAQMENQDPLEPQDNGAFLSQLAQFSTVEGIEQLNKSMTGFQQGFMSSQALQATALVGRKVEIEGSEAFVDGSNPIEGLVNLPESTADLNLHIFDSSGVLVRSESYGTAASGDVPFSWDGVDANGNSVPPGIYRVEATASQKGETQQMTTSIFANVNSVTIGTGGAVTLNVENLGEVPLHAVNKFK